MIPKDRRIGSKDTPEICLLSLTESIGKDPSKFKPFFITSPQQQQQHRPPRLLIGIFRSLVYLSRRATVRAETISQIQPLYILF